MTEQDGHNAPHEHDPRVASREVEPPEARPAPVSSGESQEVLIRRLHRSVAELTLLNDLAQDIGGSLDSHTIIQKVVTKSLRAVRAEQAVIKLVHGRKRDDPSTYVRAVASHADREQYHLDQSLLGCLYTNPAPLRSAEPRRAERLQGLKISEAIRSILCVPLTIKDRLIGILAAYNKAGEGGFTAADERLLGIIAGQSAQIIENARLYEQEKALQEVQAQLRMAKQIQMNLLPVTMPSVPGYDVAGTSLPAREVGGDYFDFIPCGDMCWAICLADVAGKGLPAALLMANLHAALRGQLGPEVRAANCVGGTNRHLCRSTERSQFVSLFLGLLDTDAHRLTFCNAGHNRPALLPARGNGRSEVHRLPSCGPLMGLVQEPVYREEAVDLAPGDLLVVFSDGITEAIDRREEEFGISRLLKEVAQVRDRSAAEIVANIVAAVKRHVGGERSLDDMTVLVVQRNF